MSRYIWIYGIIAGAIVVVASLSMITLMSDHGPAGMIVGYLSMLIALSFVFVGIRKYRDTELGGVIRFPTALGVGFGIAGVASLFYVLGWEAYLYATDYSFMDNYARSVIAGAQAKGASAAEIATLTAEMKAFGVQYTNPLFRMLMTFCEIAPVGLIVTLVSAALLRNSRFMPARAG